MKPLLLKKSSSSNGIIYLKRAFPLVFAGLGFWQLERLKVKNKRLSQFKEEMDQEPEPLHNIQESSISATDNDYGSTKRWKKYQLTGNFLDKFMYVGPRTKHAGAVGHMIIQPFQLQSSKDIVLINRGWVSDGFLKKGNFPAAPIGATNIIVARNLGDKKQWYTSDSKDDGKFISYYSIPILSERLDTSPFLFDEIERNPYPDAFPLKVDSNLLSSVPNNHLEYAFTWFSLGTLTLFWVLFE